MIYQRSVMNFECASISSKTFVHITHRFLLHVFTTHQSDNDKQYKYNDCFHDVAFSMSLCNYFRCVFIFNFFITFINPCCYLAGNPAQFIFAFFNKCFRFR